MPRGSEPRFHKAAQVARRYACDERTLDRMGRVGKFPRRLKMPTGINVWLVEDLDDFDEDLLTGRASSPDYRFTPRRRPRDPQDGSALHFDAPS